MVRKPRRRRSRSANLHEDRRRWLHRPAGQRSRLQGRPADRGLRHRRRAERRARRGPGPRARRRRRCACSPGSRTNSSSLGSALADPVPDGPVPQCRHARHVDRLESAIDALEAELPPLTQFILPGGPRPRRSSTWRGPSAARRAAGRHALATAGRGCPPRPDRLPEPAERPPLRPGPGRESPRRRGRRRLEGHLRWRLPNRDEGVACEARSS